MNRTETLSKPGTGDSTAHGTVAQPAPASGNAKVATTNLNFIEASPKTKNSSKQPADLNVALERHDDRQR